MGLSENEVPRSIHCLIIIVPMIVAMWGDMYLHIKLVIVYIYIYIYININKTMEFYPINIPWISYNNPFFGDPPGNVRSYPISDGHPQLENPPSRPGSWSTRVSLEFPGKLRRSRGAIEGKPSCQQQLEICENLICLWFLSWDVSILQLECYGPDVQILWRCGGWTS